MPAEAGVPSAASALGWHPASREVHDWIPAYAGMTGWKCLLRRQWPLGRRGRGPAHSTVRSERPLVKKPPDQLHVGSLPLQRVSGPGDTDPGPAWHGETPGVDAAPAEQVFDKRLARPLR